MAAYVVSGGCIWFLASRSTVKVKVIRRRPVASILVGSPDRAVVMAGRAEVISGWGLGDIVNLATDATGASSAMARFAFRHVDLLTRSAQDFVLDRTLPVDRVLVRLAPTRGLVLSNQVVTDRWGRWPSVARLTRSRRGEATAPILEGIPARAARALMQHDSCAVGWECAWGPMVMPGYFIPGGEVEVSAEPLRLAGALSKARACVTLERGRDRAGNFAGIILRGDGAVTRTRGQVLHVRLESDSTSWWSGLKTGTAYPPGPGSAVVGGDNSNEIGSLLHKAGGFRAARACRRASRA